MDNLFLNILLIVIAYLLGSISTAIITCRLMGLEDPRTVGSENPGATNVLRIGGKKAAFFTLLGDILKGLIPVLIGHALGVPDKWLMLIGLAAFLGHLYPVYYHFKGGKGVATGIGVYLGLHFWAGLAVVGTWLFVAKVLKISSLSALVATLLAPLFFYFIAQSIPFAVGTAVMTVLIFWRHQSNIQNLLSGKEGKIGTDKKS